MRTFPPALAPLLLTFAAVGAADDGRGDDGPSRPLRAGAAAVSVTPPVGTSLEGYFMKGGQVRQVHDDLFAKALVLDDGACRIALVVVDMTIIGGEQFDRAKRLIEERIGLPRENILMACTHTHSAPRVPLLESPRDLEYVDDLVEAMADGVCSAAERLAPAEVAAGAIDQPQYAYNRRWYMKPEAIGVDPFGQRTDRVRFNPPRGHPDLIEPAGPADPEVSLLAVRHVDGRPLAVLANYSLHYVGGIPAGTVSADYFGVFARQLARRLDAEEVQPPFVGIMSNGTSGNIGAGVDFRAPPGKPFGPYERMEQVGADLADAVARTVGGLRFDPAPRLRARQAAIALPVRRPDAGRLAWAEKVLEGADQDRPHRWTGNYAREAVLLNRWPETVPVTLQAFRIGEALIGAIPNEVFTETGLAVKAAFPNRRTFVIELANQYYGYLPTPEQHALGGYETWPARSSALAVEAEPEIRRTLIRLLREVAEERDTKGDLR